ncbi:MAG: hypothetical protein QME47_04345 [Candidatus Thermoplasmatota archaeon]|nr:hypothetical protein [Candidatus Thermoplasmatota archaeon]
MAAPPKPKSKLPIVIAVVVVVAVVVIASALWLFVFKKEKKEEGAPGPAPPGPAPYTMLLRVSATDDDANSVTWTVASVSRHDVKESDITWKLTDATGADVGILWSYHDVDNSGYLSAGDCIVVFAPQDGNYKLRALYQGSIAFESELTHY